MPAPALPDHLVEEILLRIPPDDPARLVSAALVCKPWCRIATDRGFRRRYREHHRATPPPVLGVFCNGFEEGDDADETHFFPTSSFRPPRAGGHHRGWRALDARHGRVLFCNSAWEDESVKDALVVWNPVSGEQVELPELPRHKETCPWLNWNAAVLCAAGMTEPFRPKGWCCLSRRERPLPIRSTAGVCDHLDCHSGPFLVVLVGSTMLDSFAHVYSSEIDDWSFPSSTGCTDVDHLAPSLLVGNVLYFKCEKSRVLKCNLRTLEFSMIDLPLWPDYARPTVLMATEDDRRLGFANVVDSKLYLWVREASDDGGFKCDNEGWKQSRVIELETLLPADALSSSPEAVGFADGVGVFFLQTVNGLFSIDLKSSHAKKVHDDGTDICSVVPFTSICTPDDTFSAVDHYVGLVRWYLAELPKKSLPK